MRVPRYRRQLWTEDQIAWLIALYPDVPAADVAEALQRPVGTVYARAKQLGLQKSAEFNASPASGRCLPGNDSKGLNGRFRPGAAPWNKGKHWVAGGRSAETRFKSGQLNGRAAKLVLPVGTYRVNGDGYLDRKVGTTPGAPHLRWHPVHRLVWEAAHGPVPPGHVVVFKARMRTAVLEEITLDRLELVTRAELMRRNTVHNLPKPLAQLVQLRGALVRQINRRTREKQD